MDKDRETAFQQRIESMSMQIRSLADQLREEKKQNNILTGKLSVYNRLIAPNTIVITAKEAVDE